MERFRCVLEVSYGTRIYADLTDLRGFFLAFIQNRSYFCCASLPLLCASVRTPV
ncbi:MAG: hypothetical protein FWG87_09070 [Defluviitaleaceae bacterium]|nr:hypothetical protein [Defluviitaleaceae bacterium]